MRRISFVCRSPIPGGHEYGGDFKVEKIEQIEGLLRFNLRYAGNAQVKRLNLASVSLTPEILIAALHEYNCKSTIADEAGSPTLKEHNDPSEPIQEDWIQTHGVERASSLSMMRIMARRTKAATVLV